MHARNMHSIHTRTYSNSSTYPSGLCLDEFWQTHARMGVRQKGLVTYDSQTGRGRNVRQPDGSRAPLIKLL